MNQWYARLTHVKLVYDSILSYNKLFQDLSTLFFALNYNYHMKGEQKCTDVSS
jgi:hypothetical protein